MFNKEFQQHKSPLRQAISNFYYQDETTCVETRLTQAQIAPDTIVKIQQNAEQLVTQVRAKRIESGGIDAFLFQYDLSSEEGIALMCLAEALLRIPDPHTVDNLIKDKLASADWGQHLGKSHSIFVNAATWGLMLTGKMLGDQEQSNFIQSTLHKLVKRSSEPMIRQAISQAMKILSKQFIMGSSIETALKRAKEREAMGYSYSYDMLGEAACTAEDAETYFQDYMRAIEAVGKHAANMGPIQGPGISVKLSALHPRYEWIKRTRIISELLPKIKDLALAAKNWDINLTIDAEEAERLELSLDIIEALVEDPELKNWSGFGFVIQAYQKRGLEVVNWALDLARAHQSRLMLRLVKGAYWDSEIKWAQLNGMPEYPVFTRKMATDVSYTACVKKLLSATDVIYPQFATHNAYHVALIQALAEPGMPYEFQCLHGMGDPLYDAMVGDSAGKVPCRIYAPVGGQEDLLAYLVRRLLENGANTSFVNRIANEKAPISQMIKNPSELLREVESKSHPNIPLPVKLYPDRANSTGLEFTDSSLAFPIIEKIESFYDHAWQAMSTGTQPANHLTRPVYSPMQHNHTVGWIVNVSEEELEQIIQRAHESYLAWDLTSANERANCLEKMAQLLESHKQELMALLCLEAGKTLSDANAEVREAVEFCYYYALQCREQFTPKILSGPTGEQNELCLRARGIIACISPWNFPLAIFIGQVTAALAAGNAVIAKPAGQTTLIAARAVELLHQAGVPKAVAQIAIGSGSTIGNHLIHDLRIKGILFTGSTETGRHINQVIANREGPIIPLIAETGGLNAMIVDSSALPEQVVQDVMTSAFGSAGQRCSSLRLLCLQHDIADKIIHMLKGAMAEIAVDNPMHLSTDIGPVIDNAARENLQAYVNKIQKKHQLIYQVPVSEQLLAQGSFFAPCAFEIDKVSDLTEEVFGPILHIVRYQSHELAQLISQINDNGFGLTLGIHSRISEGIIDQVCEQAKVGNIYVNRNMIGAVVGVQPFGGEGLSGTGPKAGGPHYLARLATERTVSINTTASGGNATLMTLAE